MPHQPLKTDLHFESKRCIFLHQLFMLLQLFLFFSFRSLLIILQFFQIQVVIVFHLLHDHFVGVILLLLAELLRVNVPLMQYVDLDQLPLVLLLHDVELRNEQVGALSEIYHLLSLFLCVQLIVVILLSVIVIGSFHFLEHWCDVSFE